MANEYKILQPNEFYKSFLDRKSRPDGRSLLEFRPTTLNVGSIGTADGSAIVKVGSTTVICGIKAEVAPPSQDQPGLGFIIPNVTLPPMCSSRIKSGPPGETAQAATQYMAELVKNDLVMELKNLCIVESKWVWVLHADLLCINLDGGLLDACVIALTAAMKNLAMPAVMYDEETDQLSTNLGKRTCLVGVNGLVASTFAIFDRGVTISDPTDEEEQLAAGSITITMDDSIVAHVYKPGGYTIDERKMETLIKKSEEKTKEITKLMQEACTSSVDR